MDTQRIVSPEKLTWTSGVARANGLEIAFEQAGPESGEPLLMVMGLTWQLIHWPDSLCEQLVAQGFRLTRFDNRDAGLSSSVDRGVRFDLVKDSFRKKLGLSVAANYTLVDMAKDSIGLLDALAIKRTHLVGVSMGGMISQLIAGKYPERVRSLTSIMSNTNHPWLPLPELPVLRAMLTPLPKEPTRELAVERSVKMHRLLSSSPAYRNSDADLRAMCERGFDRAFRPSGVMRQSHAIAATGSIEGFVKRIVAPTQIVHGLADKLVRPVGGKRSAKLVRHSKLTLIDGMGHDLPDKLSPRLASLIAGNAAQA